MSFRLCKKVVFQKRSNVDFYSEVKKRVNNYFKEGGISPNANYKMIAKTSFLIAIYVALYTLLISDIYGPLGVVVSYCLLGVMISLTSVDFGHDSLHGAYAKNHTMNRLLGFLFDFHGASSYVWKIRHNQQHHTFTNIHGMDDDIDKMIWFRFSPCDGRYWFHRYQHIYAPFLYAFLSLRWFFYADYPVFFEHMNQNKVSLKEGVIFFGFKALHLFVFFIAPLLFLSIPWWVTLLGFLLMHSIVGVALSFIFQLAHVVDNVEHPQPDEGGAMNDDWAVHELKTTSNFATSSMLVTAIVGGLNFQVEHHLFPYVCHVHYPEIQKIVKSTAREYQVPYNEQPTYWSALVSHFKVLKMLGRGEL